MQKFHIASKNHHKLMLQRLAFHNEFWHVDKSMDSCTTQYKYMFSQLPAELQLNVLSKLFSPHTYPKCFHLLFYAANAMLLQ